MFFCDFGCRVDAFSVSSLCSLMRIPRVCFVSPMYVALQFLHVMEHGTPSHIFCGSTLSFGLTSDLDGVVRHHCCVHIVFLHDP